MGRSRRDSSPIGQLMRLHMHGNLCMTATDGKWLVVANIGGERIEGEGDTPTLAVARAHKAMWKLLAKQEGQVPA